MFPHLIGYIADKRIYFSSSFLLVPFLQTFAFLMFHANLHNNITTSILRFLRCGVRLDSCLSSHHRRRCGIFAIWIWEAQTTSWTKSLVQALARVAVSLTSARGSEETSNGRGVRMVCGTTSCVQDVVASIWECLGGLWRCRGGVGRLAMPRAARGCNQP